MKFISFQKIALLAGMFFLLPSCFKDLDTVPIDVDELTSAAVYEDPANYKKVLAKIYSGLAVTGQQGPAGQADISGIDEGFGQYLRGYWYLQELSTDEAVIGWNDATLQDFHQQDWDARDGFVYACYSRLFYQIAICNEFLRETTDAKLDSRNTDAALKAEIQTYRSEVRFLRALSYYHALDLFRNVPFVTEDDPVGAFFPNQISANDLFNYLESELLAIEGSMVAPQQNEYGRADQAAAWTLLAKLYLNAKVYTGADKFSESVKYSAKVIDSGAYQLEPNYANIFKADNHKAKGVIFPVTFDGVRTKTYGGTTFLVHAAVGGSMSAASFGIDGGWGGIRTTSAIVNKFEVGGTGPAMTIVSPSDGNTASYPNLSVPGAYQGWDPANANTIITSVNSDDKYEGYFWFDAGTEFKFAQGGTWDVNWGDTGADGTLDAAGDNIIAAEAGFYRINVDLTALTYTMAKISWGLIGDATPTGWDSDTDMTYDAAENALVITTDLVAGAIKFRANDDWALNFGDTGANAILEENGDNIAIPAAGKYVIKLYLDKPDYTYSIATLADVTPGDGRGLFHTDGQNLEITDMSLFTEGYAFTKWRNVTSDGVQGSDPTFVDTDFPLFRIEDVYLMYAEGVLRGGAGGDLGTALQYVNAIRERAYGSADGHISSSELTLDFILDERARELYWEGHRRTDLVRFDKFTDGYLWPWKGGIPEGRAVNSNFNVFPIPAQDLGANPNLVQNPGY